MTQGMLQNQTKLQVQRIPVDEQVPGVGALTALRALPGGSVLVGTTTAQSEGAVLLQLDLETGRIHDTAFRFPPKGAPGTYGYSIGDKIHHALIAGNGALQGNYLIGHGSHIWWDDGGWPFDGHHFAGGGVYAYDPSSREARPLGVPVPNNTVHGLDGGDGFAVGYSLPDNHFFSIDYATGKMRDFGRISAYCCHSFTCTGRKAVGVYRRSVGEQRGDLVVASDHAAFLFVYDHDHARIERTELLVSDLKTNIRFNSGIDSWVTLGDVVIGGRVDGSLFRLDLDDLSLEELGHAVPTTYPDLSSEQVRRLGGWQCRSIHGAERITAMTPLDEHRIIGTAGFPVMHLFLFDLRTGVSTDLGPVNTQAEMCYFHDLVIATRPDGSRCLVMAETDSSCPDLYIVSDSAGTLFEPENHHPTSTDA